MNASFVGQVLAPRRDCADAQVYDPGCSQYWRSLSCARNGSARELLTATNPRVSYLLVALVFPHYQSSYEKIMKRRARVPNCRMARKTVNVNS